MRRIENAGDVDTIAQERALIAVYLDPAYGQEIMATIFATKRGFDAHVQNAWHILIPYAGTRRGLAVDMELHVEQYNIALAQSLIRRYGIEFTDLPAMVFVPSPGKNAFFWTLNNLSVEEIRRTMGVIGEMANEELADGPADAGDFRAKLNTRVEIYLTQQKTLRWLRRIPWADMFLGFLGFIGKGHA